MSIGHWEHVEYVSADTLQAIKRGEVVKPSIPLDANTALSVCCESVLLECVYTGKTIRPLMKSSAPNRDLRLYIDALHDPNITMLAVDGLPGSGKTSTAVEFVIDNDLSGLSANDLGKSTEPKVLIAKPYLNAGEEEYGFLPGDINEKFDPTVQNFIQYFNRKHLLGFDQLRDGGLVEVLPLGFIRGRDLPDTTIIVDECQNTKELVTMATRKAKNSRVIFLGDTSPYQIDIKGNSTHHNGLSHLTRLLKGASYFQHIELKTTNHILRSDESRDIVRRLIKTYGKDSSDWKL